MMRRPLNSATTSTSVLSLSTKSYLQRPRTFAQKKEFHCRSGFVYGESRARTKSFARVDGVFGDQSDLVRRTSGAAFVCNAQRPYGDTATLYFDGSSSGQDGPGGAGAYLLHPNGDYIWKGSRYFANADPIKAEYGGLIMGLTAARDAGIKHLSFYGDSDEVIEQMLGKRAINSNAIKTRHSKTKDLISCFQKVQCGAISRENNSVANQLARAALKSGRESSKWY